MVLKSTEKCPIRKVQRRKWHETEAEHGVMQTQAKDSQICQLSPEARRSTGKGPVLEPEERLGLWQQLHFGVLDQKDDEISFFCYESSKWW